MDMYTTYQVSRINTSSWKPTVSTRLSIVIAILMLAMVFLLSACGTTVTPASSSTVAPDPATPPAGAEICKGEKGNYTCKNGDHPLTLTSVPDEVTPYLLPVGDVASLSKLPKDDRIGCVISIIGNLAFYDSNQNLYTKFPSEVSLTYPFTDADQAKFKQCQDDLVTQHPNLAATEFDFQPIYLYNKSDKVIWEPFDNYEPKIDSVTVHFTTWGDQQIGYGTKP